MPLVVVWPGQVRAGSTSREVVSSIDHYPTILEMLGLKPKPGQLLDGTSMAPALRGGKLARDTLFWHFPHAAVDPGRFPSTAVRQGDWKLIRCYADGPKQADRFELYNLKDDLGETENLADAMPDRVRQLNALITRHLDDTQALVAKANPAYRPPVLGWSGNKDGSVTLDKGALLMTCTGGDPMMVNNDVPAVPGPLRVELRMQARSKGRAQLFWITKENRVWFRDRSVLFDVAHDGQWRDYRLELKVDGTLTGLRFDPSQAPGEIRIAHLRLLDAQGKLLRDWAFDKAEAK